MKTFPRNSMLQKDFRYVHHPHLTDILASKYCWEVADGEVFSSGSNLLSGVTFKYDKLEGNIENWSHLEIGLVGF